MASAKSLPQATLTMEHGARGGPKGLAI